MRGRSARRGRIGRTGVDAALVTVLALALAACGSRATPGSSGGTAAGATAAAVAPSGFSWVRVRVVAPDGSVSERCLLIASDETSRRQGLMGVSDPALVGINGMVFAFADDTTAGFWMKDTLIPLSIAFADRAGAVISVADMDPCAKGTDPCPVTRAPKSYRLAIEMARGALSGSGVIPGARVSYRADGTCGPHG